jgi:hypothetical protein
MMIKWAAVAALMFSSVNAFAYTNCSDSTGANRYEDNNFRGGPAPRPETIVDDVKIYLNSELASESTSRYDGSGVPGPLVVNFDNSSMTVLNSFQSGMIKDYAIRVSFPVANESQFPGGGPVSPVFLMICHQDNTPVP